MNLWIRLAILITHFLHLNVIHTTEIMWRDETPHHHIYSYFSDCKKLVINSFWGNTPQLLKYTCTDKRNCTKSSRNTNLGQCEQWGTGGFGTNGSGETREKST